MSLVIFFILAIIAVGAAVMVVTSKSPISSALFLVLVMCSLAGFFVLMNALFLAALQVIVYAGAIMVLFLFVIMLLDLRHDEYGRDSHSMQKYFGFALAAVLLVQGVILIGWAMKDYNLTGPVAQIEGAPSDTLQDYSSANHVARTLFLKYAYPFEVTSILLLSAIIGAVVIARRKRLPDLEGEED